MANSYGSQVFAQLEYDMAPFVGKTDAYDTIKFPESFFRDTFIDVQWTITEEKKVGRQSTLGGSFIGVPVEIKTFTQDEIDSFIKSAEALETKKVQLTAELEVVQKAKEEQMEIMKNEHKNSLALQAKLD